MYEKTDKRRIYQLIDMYLSGQIDAWSFCNDYYYCYDLELDSNTLTELEANVFSELGTVSGRFTNIEEDLKKYPGTYFSEEQLKLKIIEAKEKLTE
jgi:hypothetical protein